MRHINYEQPPDPGSFGSGNGQVRFFRRYEPTDDPSHRREVRDHYCDEEIRVRLEEHFDRDKPFLRPRYLLNNLVDEIGIPRHVLSAAVQRLYGVGFPTLVNRYRIGFLLDNRNRKEWRKYTQEAIGMECGFNSRNSFIKNVQRFLGKNPSEIMDGTPEGVDGIAFLLTMVQSPMRKTD